MRILPILLLVACGPPPDPVGEAWNAVFRIDEVTEGEGCDPPSVVVEAFAPYIGIGLAQGEPDVMSLYYCNGADECDPVPFASAWLEELDEASVYGEQGTVLVSAEKLCHVWWYGLSGEVSATGELSMEVRSFESEPSNVDVAAECDSVLQSVYGSVCDTTQIFRATRVQ